MKAMPFALAAVAVALSPAAGAGEIITRLRADPASNAKVQRYLAEAYRVATPGSEYNWKKDIKVEESCQMNMGNVTTSPGQQAPRDMVTVIKGNVINFCR